MNLLNRICQNFVQRVKRVRSFFKTIEAAARQRQRQIIREEHEAERLDRIRNPSKYQCK